MRESIFDGIVYYKILFFIGQGSLKPGNHIKSIKPLNAYISLNFIYLFLQCLKKPHSEFALSVEEVVAGHILVTSLEHQSMLARA